MTIKLLRVQCDGGYKKCENPAMTRIFVLRTFFLCLMQEYVRVEPDFWLIDTVLLASIRWKVRGFKKQPPFSPFSLK